MRKSKSSIGPKSQSLIPLMFCAVASTSVLAQTASPNQPPVFDNILYGAAYYNEYMPADPSRALGRPPRQRRRPDESSRHQRRPHGRVHLEPLGARRRPLRIRLDGPRRRRHGQSRHQGHHGHAHLLRSHMDGPRPSRNPRPLPGRRHQHHLRHAPEHGHRQPHLPLLRPAPHHQHGRPLPRQPHRHRLADRQRNRLLRRLQSRRLHRLRQPPQAEVRLAPKP